MKEKQILAEIKMGTPFRREGFEIIYGVFESQYGLILNKLNFEGKYKAFSLSDSEALKMIKENI